MYIDDKGIVLRCVKYDDKSFIASLFTASHGCVSFVVSAGTGRRTGAVARLYQPLSFLSFQWNQKPNTAIFRMKDVHPLFIFQDIPLHPVKRAVALLLGEFMASALRSEAENPSLYEYMEYSFRWFDAASDSFASFHLVYLLKLLHFMGIAPNVESYADGSLFDLQSALFVPSGIPSSVLLSSYDSSLLFRLARTNYNDMSAIPMNKADRTRLLDALVRYYTLHVPGFHDLHSLDIVCQLFQ